MANRIFKYHVFYHYVLLKGSEITQGFGSTGITRGMEINSMDEIRDTEEQIKERDNNLVKVVISNFQLLHQE